MSGRLDDPANPPCGPPVCRLCFDSEEKAQLCLETPFSSTFLIRSGCSSLVTYGSQSLSDVAGTNRKAVVVETGMCPESDGVPGSLLKCHCLWETHRTSRLPRACYLKHSPQGVTGGVSVLGSWPSPLFFFYSIRVYLVMKEITVVPIELGGGEGHILSYPSSHYLLVWL